MHPVKQADQGQLTGVMSFSAPLDSHPSLNAFLTAVQLTSILSILLHEPHHQEQDMGSGSLTTKIILHGRWRTSAKEESHLYYFPPAKRLTLRLIYYR